MRILTTDSLSGHGRPGAFSIVEILTVMVIVAALSSLVAPAMHNLGRSTLLGEEGNRLVNLVNQAAQNSSSRNTVTALIATSAGPNAFGLFEYSSDLNTWTQVGRWEVLKQGIVSDPASGATFISSGVQPQHPFPPLYFRGQLLNTYQYIIFLPNRSLQQNSSAQVTLVEGHYPPGSATPVYSHPGPDGTPANYYLVTVMGTTGRPKIDRP